MRQPYFRVRPLEGTPDWTECFALLTFPLNRNKPFYTRQSIASR